MSNDNEEKKQTQSDENRSSDRRGGSGQQRRSGGGGNFRRPRRGGPGGRGGKRRGKMNSFCPKGTCFNYKDIDTLQRYVTETGKIKPRRQTGNCSRCQRELAREVKRARHLALLPFVISND